MYTHKSNHLYWYLSYILNLEKIDHYLLKMAQKFQTLKSFVFRKFSTFTNFIQSNPFYTQAIYFSSLSSLGLLALKILVPVNVPKEPRNLDLFFMSVSALTVSSMATVEMESFSDSQLWVFTLLMLFGSEVFTSMLGVQFMKVKLSREHSIKGMFNSDVADIESSVLKDTSDNQKAIDCMSCLVYVVLGYLTMVIFTGSVSIFLYLVTVKQAARLLVAKGINLLTFSVFTAVSSFANCGFTPDNEGMVLFRKNSFLLLILIPQILAGNTLYPPLLRFLIWFLKKFTGKEEYGYLLQQQSTVKYKHMFLPKACIYLSLTALGFILVQTVVFWGLDWESEVLQGMNWYQKIVGSIFLAVNSRHAGESVVDLSKLSSAVLVLFAVMMYLPPYTSYVPIASNDKISSEVSDKDSDVKNRTTENLIFSQLTYIVIFVILVCITERRSMQTDPLNFNVFNIAFEVVSAYGNVGFSMGYSCEKLLEPDRSCEDASYGFVGKWSSKGKLVLIVVMIFGRLKKFNMHGGRAWKIG